MKTTVARALARATPRGRTRVLALASALAAGLLFGIGLVVSPLCDPARVLAFLDIAGDWDPSLLLVMGAAVAVGLVAFGIARHRRSTLIGLPLQVPAAAQVDGRLVVGASLFGVGWGLAGICPGPGFVTLGMGSAPAALYVVALMAGMASFDRLERWSASRAAASGQAASDSCERARRA